jgi:protoporphyrin/coproporphyrin ferrochelatase
VIGLLLVNLGSPAAPTTGAVRTYLRQFLSDPRVIDINPVGRALLLNAVILPFRPAKSAAAYQQIWSAERGSPLVYHSRDLVTAVQAKLGDGYRVVLAMRYGEPSIEHALAELRGVDRLVVLPLYPQYSSASTGSSVEEIYRLLGERWVIPSVSVLPAFYDHPGYLDAFAAVGRPVLDGDRFDHVLFSFHGLPERHMHKADDSGAHCLRSDGCCEQIVPANRDCYRAQSFATARALAARLQLAEGTWSVSFQSRLGRTPWIRPYTDLVLPELAQRGVKRIAVFSPAFVADCLETLEELGMRAVEQWRELGGEQLTLVPSLNATPVWVDAVCAMVQA